MKRYDLLLALNGIIAAAPDTDAAAIMLERTEALHKQVKAEAEPLAVVEGWANAHNIAEIALEVGAIAARPVPDRERPTHAPRKPVTVTITERKT